MTEKAYAKINLTLDVLNKRDDGYHEIKTVMQTVTLCDILDVEKEKDILIYSDKRFIPTDKRNLIFKACERFFEFTEIKSGAKINLVKRIPVAAGLAGGSTDAAATLRALNRLYKTKLSDDELCKIGATFGADIPFCIKGGTALCEGIGEKITALQHVPQMFVVISIGGEGMSTPVMYADFDKRTNLAYIDNDGMINSINKGDREGIISRLGNVFEEICIDKRPFVSVIKKLMLENGALNAIMSGSGPSVFGIFESRKMAVNCAEILKDKGYYAFHGTTV
ncbi:MAG: 4-(cytidine 5'-diphospho)-2-C-methyl-D-erythritol kinase [Clostridiales bacterium GWF2_36_10]|nr:MAG: 4-(cytidine 5'-diphospho)-2-C-methyl-D-erythritol kinase [Clostridiales bacterium GWF2_36_10]HAN21322.1 4-(cytidine 5'-diphospho)-2-C-methyl-D-erythritol kinase [Clostridiales bacterium]